MYTTLVFVLLTYILLLLGIPNSDARLSILTTLLKRIPNTLTPDDIYTIASKAHGYVGADLAAVCREAGLFCIRRNAQSGKRVMSHTHTHMDCTLTKGK